MYRAALVEMTRMVRLMKAWDHEAAKEERRLKRRLKATDKAGQAGMAADRMETLAEMRARHADERRAFMSRAIASWAAKEDATTRRPLEPRGPWPQRLA